MEIKNYTELFKSILEEYGIAENAKFELIEVFDKGMPRYDLYLDNKFLITFEESLNLKHGELPESFKQFIKNIENSIFYKQQNEKIAELKQEVERLKPFEIYYNMQMELNKASK